MYCVYPIELLRFTSVGHLSTHAPLLLRNGQRRKRERRAGPKVVKENGMQEPDRFIRLGTT